MNIVLPKLAFWCAWDCECSGANGECWNIGTKLTSHGVPEAWLQHLRTHHFECKWYVLVISPQPTRRIIYISSSTQNHWLNKLKVSTIVRQWWRHLEWSIQTQRHSLSYKKFQNLPQPELSSGTLTNSFTIRDGDQKHDCAIIQTPPTRNTTTFATCLPNVLAKKKHQQ